MAELKLRRFERKVGNKGKWVECRLIEVKAGDRFRGFECDTNELICEEVAARDAKLENGRPVVVVDMNALKGPLKVAKNAKA